MFYIYNFETVEINKIVKTKIINRKNRCLTCPPN